ncbi:unnamed protein product [Calypogeia fissa]
MPGPWSSWRKLLSCKTDRDQVIQSQLACTPSRQPRKPYRIRSCSRSFASLRDVIHGNTRVVHKQSSPPSGHNSDDGGGQRQLQLRLSSSDDFFLDNRSSSGGTPSEAGSTYGRSLSLTSTPLSTTSYSYVLRGTPLRKLSGCYDCTLAYETLDSMQLIYRDNSIHGSYCGSPRAGCFKCGESFSKPEALEQHHLSQHAVTELNRGDSSRNVVEIIFRTSWLKKEIPCGRIERILKVHNTQKTVQKFEEYRDAVKTRAAKLPKKNPRCIADGNELLRFYGTVLMCHLGHNGSTNLCMLHNCHCCQLIRSGFNVKKENGKGGGIYTTATSGKAHDSVVLSEDERLKGKRAMLVCRVIAGRTHKASDSDDLLNPPSGFDSLVGDSGPYTNIDELLVFSSRGVLPCFVVIYKC